MSFILALAVAYFSPLILVSVASSLWLLLFREFRMPAQELADFKRCPFRKEIQYDMGEMNVVSFEILGKPATSRLDFAVESSPASLVDIGSGDGRTSLLYLRHIFGPDKDILLTDAVPNADSWRALLNSDQNLAFSEASVTNKDLFEYIDSIQPAQRCTIALLNSLHHLSSDDFLRLLKEARKRNLWIFVMDAKRLSWRHPLLIPFFYWFAYVVLAWRGSGAHFHSAAILKRFISVAVEAWIMCFDQAVGAARRFSMDEMLRHSSQNKFVCVADQDWLMNYVILIPWPGGDVS